MAIMLFIFLVFLRPPQTAARHETIGNGLIEPFEGDDLRRVAGYGEEKLSTVVVGGTVLCDFLLDGVSRLHSNPIHGALMEVLCNTSRKTSISDWVRGTTDEYGDFLVDLPSHLHAAPNMEKTCIVRILEVPKSSPCHRAFRKEHMGIKLSSVKNGFRTYTTHHIHLTPK